MALLDFLKKKQEAEKARESVGQPVAKKSAPEAKAAPSKAAKPAKTAKRTAGFSYDAVYQPHISEKATIRAEQANEYVFKVAARASRQEIRNAIEALYGVKVTGVNVITVHSKRRRLGRIEGTKKGYRKAVVKVKEGQKIEIF